MKKTENNDYSKLLGPIEFYKCKTIPNQRNKLGFMSRIPLFSSRNKPRKINRNIRSPQTRRVLRVKRSPQRQGENLFVMDGVGDGTVNQTILTDDRSRVGRIEDEYNVVYFEDSADLTLHNENKEGLAFGLQETKITVSDQEKVFDEMRSNKTYFEVIRVLDRGTDPCISEEFTTKDDKETDPLIPGDSEIFDWGQVKEELMRKIKEKNQIIEECLNEGNLLLADVEEGKIKCIPKGNLTQLLSTCSSMKEGTIVPREFFRFSRILVEELMNQYLDLQKQLEIREKGYQNDIKLLNKEKSEHENKLNDLKLKFEMITNKSNKEAYDFIQLETKIRNLESSLEGGRKVLKDTERNYKGRIGKLEDELTIEKQAQSKLKTDLEEKIQLVSQLRNNFEKLKITSEDLKQQLKDVHSLYKAKISKLETEHSNKLTSLCENQTQANKQLSQALEQSSNYVHQLQELRKENAALKATSTAAMEKVGVMEKELAKIQEKCGTTERKLSRETQEVMSLRSQLERLEALKEEELLSVDGDTWCEIMYQQDQWILDDLRHSLQEKEKNLEILRAQGDCPLKDFERVQKELQQRRQQFSELKDVFLDFEKKRDSVVREQREFYSKMMFLNKKTVPKDKFFRNLIEECQSKKEKVEKLECKLNESEKFIEESKKISDAQMKAMQMEMKYTAEKLYEFEHQLRIKDMELQNVIRVFEQEKKNKITAEEAMNTYKLLLEDSKKDNLEIRNKLNYFEDLEKNRNSVLKVTEELAKETQKREEAECKLVELEKQLQIVKKENQSKEKLTARSDHNSEKSSKEFDHLKLQVQELTGNNKYLERILLESQKSKEVLQRDHEDLCKKMRHAVHVMMEAKQTQEALELKLDQRKHVICQLQKSQADTEERLDSLREVLEDMKHTIDLLHQDKEELQNKLMNHMHCSAERTLLQELTQLKRDKSLIEEQNAHEKEILLHQLRNNEETMNEQHKHLKAFQEQLDNLNSQLRDTRGQLASERHQHTQQLLNLQTDKKKLEIYIKEMEERLAYERKHKVEPPSDTPISSPKFTTSDSYDTPIRDYNKYYYRK